MGDVTVILDAVQRGEQHAAEELIPLVYDELRQLATSRMARERPGQTIQATELVHEAYLRLLGPTTHRWDGRGHFFAAAAEAMRRILIDRARRKKRARHGGKLQRVDIDVIELPGFETDERLLALHEALDELESVNSSAATLIKLRFFIGLTHAQAAEVLGISRQTADNRWAFAKAWLYRALTEVERGGTSA
jgi:RNA polymerase sigma factor (TIGR02999 family)